MNLFWGTYVLSVLMLFSQPLSGQSMPDYDEKSELKICTLSYKVFAKNTFKTKKNGQRWCQSFGKYSKSCRIAKREKGGWDGFFFLSQKLEAANVQLALRSYGSFLHNENRFLRPRFDHRWRVKDCFKENYEREKRDY